MPPEPGKSTDELSAAVKKALAAIKYEPKVSARAWARLTGEPVVWGACTRSSQAVPNVHWDVREWEDTGVPEVSAAMRAALRGCGRPVQFGRKAGRGYRLRDEEGSAVDQAERGWRWVTKSGWLRTPAGETVEEYRARGGAVRRFDPDGNPVEGV